MHFDRVSFLALLAGLLVAGPMLAPAGHAQVLGPAPLSTGGFSGAPAPAPVLPSPDGLAPAAPKAKPKPKVVAQPPFTSGSWRATTSARVSTRTASPPSMKLLRNTWRLPMLAAGRSCLRGVTLKPGSEGEHVLTLRQRLAAEGDLAAADITNPVFDASLAAGVKRFQARHGQSQNALVQGVDAGLRCGSPRVNASHSSTRAHAGWPCAISRSGIAMSSSIFPPLRWKRSRTASWRSASSRLSARRTGHRPRWKPASPTSISTRHGRCRSRSSRKTSSRKCRRIPAISQKAKIRIYGVSGNEVEPSAIDWKTERAVAFTLRQDAGTANALGQIRIDMPNRDVGLYARYALEAPVPQRSSLQFIRLRAGRECPGFRAMDSRGCQRPGKHRRTGQQGMGSSGA